MPFSFTQIEHQRSRAINYGVALLVLFYFLSFWVIIFTLRMFFYEWFTIIPPGGLGAFEVDIQFQFFSWPENIVVLVLAILVGLLHFELSTRNLVPKIVRVLRGKRPDPNNFRQKQFLNILGELSAATGGRRFDGFIIPSRAINAFAVADFQGRQAIGVTRGLLSKLKRPQIEAVTAHEAAHLLTADALDTTVLVSLFNLPSELLKDMSLDFDSPALYAARFSIRGLFSYAAFWFMLFLSKTVGILLNLFLSRQREFRADAIAVRLTRDPLSLAEALYKASFYWHGAGRAGEYLSPIFIVRPRYSQLEESGSLLADLLSTHPPLDERLKVLLNIAHLSMAQFEEVMALDPHIMIKKVQQRAEEEKWMIRQDDQWKGPFTLDEIREGKFAQPETLVKRLGQAAIVMAAEDILVKKVIAQSDSENKKKILCPKCYRTLKPLPYEGSLILNCPKCEGVLVEEKDLTTILETQEAAFGDDIIELALLAREEHIFMKRNGENVLKNAYQYPCPKCQDYQKRMKRRFYNQRYHVEIDQCLLCQLTWFDKDELEILQYLYKQDNKNIEVK